MLLRPFDEYSTAYPHVENRREDGILELRIHSEGKSVKWGAGSHGELTNLYTEIALDTMYIDGEVVDTSSSAPDADESVAGDLRGRGEVSIALTATNHGQKVSTGTARVLLMKR